MNQKRNRSIFHTSYCTLLTKNPPRFLLLLITIFLLIMPFFWLPFGTMDLGGDITRLYFYDPVAFLKNYAFYGVLPEGFGGVNPNYYFLPFLLLLIFLKSFLSSYMLITVFNCVKLVVGFWAMYGVVKEFIDKKIHRQITEYVAILAGLFYILSGTMIGNYDKALLSHNQVFLNPLVFFLLLKFFTTKKYYFAWIFLFVSLIFSSNFSYDAAPPFFAFYPLSLVFLLLYSIFIRKQAFPWKKSIIIIMLFLGLQAFQLVPQLLDLLSAGSFTNTRVFARASIIHDGMQYFISVLPLAKVSTNILLPSPDTRFVWLSFLVPSIVLVGFLLQKKKNNAMLLTGIFFLITLFLLSANITTLGVNFYKLLFYLPGFSIFRNFVGQWLFIFSFFYALLFGQSLVYLFERLPKKFLLGSILFIIVAFICSSWQFVTGDLVNKIIFTSPKKHIAMTMDPKFLASMHAVQKLPQGKVIIFPFSDAFYEVVPGASDGVYIGSSILSYIGGRSSFSGYQIMQPFSLGGRSSFSGYQIKQPFSEDLFRLSREKKYQEIQKLLGLLDIRYIFHNANPKMYDNLTPDYYQYSRQSLPATQKGYTDFIHQLHAKEVSSFGEYHIYALPDTYFLPQFFIADKICHPQQKFCDVSQKKLPELFVTKHDPSFYTLHVKRQKDPFVLVFSDAFNTNWELSTDNGKIFSQHFPINQYANGWYINPKNLDQKNDITLTLSLKSQKIFYICLTISSLFFFGILLWGISLFFKRRNWYNK